jgi:hypothetical protein
MTIRSDTEVKQIGIAALVGELGHVDAERFIMLLNRDPFDYTTWQKNLFENLSVNDLSSKAMAAKKSDK